MLTIKSVEFKHDHFGPTEVHATMSDGSNMFIFQYYSDEISFSREELIGLTKQQATALFHKKDVAYLQS